MTWPRESKIEAYLVKRVHEKGGEIRKVKWIGRRGAPDRLVMLPDRPPQDYELMGGKAPRVIWIELKAPGVEAEPHQLREHERMRNFGMVVFIIDSIEAVEKALS